MRHGKKSKSLGRTSAHRKAMLSNMACSLIEHKRINTTVAKAKALRVYLEPLLTKAITDLYREVAPKIADRPGGYLRIIRIGTRLGDNAEMCMIELVDFNELMTKEPKEKKTRRSRRGGGAATDAATTTTTEETAKEEKKAEPKAEAKKEEPKAKKEAPKKSEPKAEAKKETPKKEDKKDDKKEK